MSNVPTVGRGALLAKYMQEKELQQQQQQQPGAQSEQAAANAPPVPRGRAALLLRQQQLDTASSSPGSSSAALSGRGRALALASKLESTVVNVTGLAPQFEKIKIEDPKLDPDSPVIMHGELGEKIQATANYIRLKMAPGSGIFEYEVKFEPLIDSLNIRFRFVNAKFGRKKTFDGSILYLPQMLPEPVTVESVVGNDGERFKMSIIFKKKKQVKDCLHTYNVCFKRILEILKFAQLGRSHFNPNAAHIIPQHKLEVWPGYVTAVDEYEGGIMLCCDTSHRVLRTQTVLDLVRDMMRQNPQRYKESFLKEVIGQSVLTRYNNKLYRISDVDWQQTPMSTFTATKKGQEITINYKEYYKTHYELDIRDDKQPLLLSELKRDIPGTNKKELHMVCLVPELCYMTGLTDAMTSDFKVMKDISSFTRITPNQRLKGLKTFIKNVAESEEATAVLATWGLSMEADTAHVDARVASAENITFGNGVVVKGTREADWNNALSRQSVIVAIELKKWCIIHTIRNKNEMHSFLDLMLKCCPQMGITCSPPEVKQISNDSTDSFLRAIKELNNTGTQIVVIICPTARDDRYAAIKKLTCADQALPSQVINARTLSRTDKNRSIVQKIALQMNCKLGGTLWAVDLPFKNIMVIGFDTYHDPTKRGASVGGFVASLNPQLTRWYSRVCIQEPQQELIENLKVNFAAAVQRYFDLNHSYPARIIIYRDGLGDGQLNMSRNFEVPQLQSCYPFISETFNPKMTMIICQKRINTRIFAMRGGGGDLDNPPPGTIVDNTINRRNWYDFFLVSQHVRQGTVTPTHYVVVYDDCQMKVDHIQKLTFKLCHMYYNWPGTIRVPAPVQYAHKLAQLVGQCVKRAPALSLSDQLYFL